MAYSDRDDRSSGRISINSNCEWESAPGDTLVVAGESLGSRCSVAVEFDVRLLSRFDCERFAFDVRCLFDNLTSNLDIYNRDIGELKILTSDH